MFPTCVQSVALICCRLFLLDEAANTPWVTLFISVFE